SKTKQRKLRKLQQAQALGVHESMAPQFVLKPHEAKHGVGVKDIRELVLWCLADGINPSWMLVKNKPYLQRMVVLMVPYLDASILQNGYGLDGRAIPMSELVREASARCERDPALPQGMFAFLPRMSECFTHACPTRGPADKFRLQSPVAALLQCPLTKAEIKQQKELDMAHGKPGQKLVARDLLASVAELKESHYPLPPSVSGTPLEAGWLATEPCAATAGKDAADDAQDPAMYAIDCEMVMSATGYQLARVTLVNADGDITLDELIKQEQPVTDYLTKYSGMTKEKLDAATTTFDEVRAQIMSHVHADTILIGHSLESDLNVLKLAHATVIDTAIIYTHPRGPPFRCSLRWLSSKYMERQIQQEAVDEHGQPVGHDSAEDARACLDLVKLKLEKGYEFGRHARETVSLFYRLRQQTPPRLSAVADHPNGRNTYMEADTFVPCDSDAEVIDAMLAQTKSHQFVFGKLRALEQLYNPKHQGSKDDKSQEVTAVAAAAAAATAPLVPHPETLKQLDEQVRRLFDGLPTGTSLVIFSGHGDPREALWYVVGAHKNLLVWPCAHRLVLLASVLSGSTTLRLADAASRPTHLWPPAPPLPKPMASNCAVPSWQHDWAFPFTWPDKLLCHNVLHKAQHRVAIVHSIRRASMLTLRLIAMWASAIRLVV
ncbi:hypothetical protein THASP1DRAFT_17105, partial [Thamnocephalis sphaerospora]